jgi:acetyl esterase/lipase
LNDMLTGALCNVVFAVMLTPTVTVAQDVTLKATPSALPAISAASFYGPNDIASTSLSPSGRWLALTMMQPAGDRNMLVVLDLHGEQGMKTAAGFTDSDIDDVNWLDDDRIVFDFRDSQSGSGERRRGAGLFVVARDGKGMKPLVRLESQGITRAGSMLDNRHVLPPTHWLLHVPAGGGDDVIVGEGSWDAGGALESVLPKRLDVVTGRSRVISGNAPRFVRDWWFDATGEPRVAAVVRDGRSRVLWRAPGQDEWKEIGNFVDFKEPWWPHSLDGSGRLWVTADDESSDERVLKRFDVETGRPEDSTVVATPGFSVTARLVSESPGSPILGVRVDTDAEVTVWLEPKLRELQDVIDKRLPGRINRLQCRRCGQVDMTVLVRSYSDRVPGELLVWRATTKALQFVGKVRQAIDSARMGSTEFHRIKARDGRDLPVWLTMPAGAHTRVPLPTVVLVHGGPWVRGRYWRWNDDVQFLASRGYLVIEPEFRGSTGFGGDHFRAGWRQWGQAMQDDVADALLWAVKQGQADGKRACIAGASYGGYAALMGLVKHPELYRCGVAWVAVSDPGLMFTSPWSDISLQSKRYGYRVLIGDPVADAEMFTSISPLQQAKRIKAPVLLAMGDLDRRVPLEHGTRMRDALREAGNEPEWVVYPLEGHGWQLMQTRLDFALRVERFLARHLAQP